jgi:hypothetical protein
VSVGSRVGEQLVLILGGAHSQVWSQDASDYRRVLVHHVVEVVELLLLHAALHFHQLHMLSLEGLHSHSLIFFLHRSFPPLLLQREANPPFLPLLSLSLLGLLDVRVSS